MLKDIGATLQRLRRMFYRFVSPGSARRLSVLLLCVCAGLSSAAHGQALTTASRVGDLQLGAGYGAAESDYGSYRLRGFTLYGSFDFSKHYGAEFDFHQMNQPDTQLYERSYELGGRYIPKHYGPLTPYAKVLYGRGVLNETHGYFNIAYNMFVGGGGVEYEAKPWLKVRVDAEYQDWLSGPGLPHGLTPVVGTVGVAYRFGPGKPPGRQWIFPKPPPEKKPAAEAVMPPKG